MKQHCFAIVRAKFNPEVTDGLLSGALRAFRDAKVSQKNITVLEVPGSWEIPFAVAKLARLKKYAAIVTIGAVIKHETSHDYWINHAIFPELQRIAADTCVPVTLGILTCDNEQQAEQRSGNNNENRGYLAAKAALAMANINIP